MALEHARNRPPPTCAIPKRPGRANTCTCHHHSGMLSVSMDTVPLTREHSMQRFIRATAVLLLGTGLSSPVMAKVVASQSRRTPVTCTCMQTGWFNSRVQTPTACIAYMPIRRLIPQALISTMEFRSYRSNGHHGTNCQRRQGCSASPPCPPRSPTRTAPAYTRCQVTLPTHCNSSIKLRHFTPYLHINKLVSSDVCQTLSCFTPLHNSTWKSEYVSIQP